MFERIKDAIADNIILVFWLMVALVFIVLEKHVEQWIECGKYVVGQHLINGGLNTPWGFSRQVAGVTPTYPFTNKPTIRGGDSQNDNMRP